MHLFTKLYRNYQYFIFCLLVCLVGVFVTVKKRAFKPFSRKKPTLGVKLKKHTPFRLKKNFFCIIILI